MKVCIATVIYNKAIPSHSMYNLKFLNCRCIDGKIHGVYLFGNEGDIFYPDYINKGIFKKEITTDNHIEDPHEFINIRGGFYFDDDEDISNKIKKIKKDIILEIQKLYDEQLKEINDQIESLRLKKIKLGTFIADAEEYFLKSNF